ncbi:MAG: transglycosylase domain-containing protein [Erysipelotrichaceae bacterium]|nr:transglycosylase domain-containing protein [Erysipelotrichaceae bacterium]
MTEKKTKEPRQKREKKKLKWNWKTFFLVLICAVVFIGFAGAVGGGALIYSMASKAPEVTVDAFESPESSQILDRNNNLIAEVGYQKRANVTYEDIPNSLIDALVSIEDSRFFVHSGFDLARFTKAMIENVLATLKAGRIVFAQGGSTLTMQLVDNSYFKNEDGGDTGANGIEQKVQEIYMAMQLEGQTSKKAILEYYLNKINFGGSGNIRGVQKAAEFYFNKHVSELTLSESALLAGVVNAPYRYNPHINLDLATERRNTVLNLMVRHGYITEQEAKLAKSINIEDQLVDSSSANRGSGNGDPYQAYIDVVVQEVKDLTGMDPSVVPMKIYTHMDPDVQATVDQLQAGELVEFPDEKMEMALVSIDNDTGEIVAIGGGRSYADGGSMLLNLATDQYAQPGSSVKPFLSYALAFEYLGWATSHTLLDQPIAYKGTTKVIGNADGKYHGQLTMLEAVARSLNTPAIQTLEEVISSQKDGRAKVVEYLQNLGFSKVTDESFDIGYAIGGSTFQANAVELAGAQAAMINYGSYIQPHTVKRIEFNDGSTPVEPVYTPVKVISEEAAYLTTELYYNNIWGGIFNYMQTLKRDYPTYAKTGTSNWGEEAKQFGIPVGNAKDKWMISSSSEYTTALWIGYDKAYSDYYWTSAKTKLNLPGNISSIMMDALHKDNKPEGVKKPDGVVNLTHIIGTYPYSAPIEGQSEYLITGKIKKEFASLVDPQTSTVETLASFVPTLDSAGNMNLQWSDYPDPSKLTMADTTMDLTREVYSGKWVEAYGNRIFDWTWLYGPIRYRADIYINDQIIDTVTSESSTAQHKVEMKPGSKIKACGFYVYEKSGTQSNQLCTEWQVEDKVLTLTAPDKTASQSAISNWAATNAIVNVSFVQKETNDQKLANTNEMVITVIKEDGSSETFNNSSTFSVKQSQLPEVKVSVTLYSYKAPDPTATPETPSVPESNQIPNCIEGGRNEAGNNVCKVCAEGYELTDGQCSKIQESSEESGT